MLGGLIDQHAGDKGVWTPFLVGWRRPLRFRQSWRKRQAQHCAGQYCYLWTRAWRVEVDDFIPGREASTAEITARINLSLEKQIRKNPSDWFWVHNRWKTPNPQFLLRHYHRGVYVSAEVERLKPFRVLIRSSDLPDGAAMSVEEHDGLNGDALTYALPFWSSIGWQISGATFPK